MSLIAKLIIGGWATTLAMVGVCALSQSGQLLGIRKRIASWLEASSGPIEANETTSPELTS
jgi:hypothetical protein